LDLAIGGGGCYFLPQSNPFSCRGDDVDLVSKAKAEGWYAKVLFGQEDSNQMPALSVGHNGRQGRSANHSLEPLSILSQDLELPLLALLAPFNTPYEIDRADDQPDLSSLALKALETLDKSPKNDKGFLIMIEGSQIDLCAHQNDPACHAREIEAYQKAIEKVSQWVDSKNKAGEKTILISTSDHETGGLALGRQLGAQYPSK
jgi:alkaline phosphatase